MRKGPGLHEGPWEPKPWPELSVLPAVLVICVDLTAKALWFIAVPRALQRSPLGLGTGSPSLQACSSCAPAPLSSLHQQSMGV